MLRFFLTVLSVALLAASASSHAAVTAKQKIELRGGAKVYEYVLPSQLTLIVIEKPDAPLTSIYHWVKAGSLNETPGITGIAHLFEHMMFRPLAPGEPSFDDKVSKFGANVNANTRFESTVYTTTVPTRHLATVLQAEAARFKGLKVTDELLDIEREAVRSEYQTGLDSNPILDFWYATYVKGFPGHPLGWQIVGVREDLDKIKATDCNAFFAKHYRPNNTGLIIGGAVSAPEVLRLVEASYGDWEAGPKLATPASYTGKGAVLAEGKLASPARSTVFGFRVPLYSELDAQAVQLANWILFQSSYSLVRRRLSIDQTLAVGVEDFNFDYDNGMLKGTANLLPNVTLPKLQMELAQLGGDFARLSDAEYDAYMKQMFIRAQDGGLRNEGLVALAAQSWGKFGGLQYMQSMLAGKPVANLRGKTKALVEQYVKADNLVLVHGKGDK
jgi:predicted Zn-dependent peptidase